MAGDGTRQAKRYEWALFALVLVSNYFGGVLLAIYYVIALPIYVTTQSPNDIIGDQLVAGLIVVLFASVTGVATARRPIRRALRWIAEERDPTDEERSAVSALPRRLSTIGTVHWVVSVTLLVAYMLWVIGYDPGTSPVLRSLCAASMLGIVPWSLSYFFVERALRPVVARSMTEDVTVVPKTMSITSRLVMSWVGTTLLPISAIVIALWGVNGVYLKRTMPVVFAICFLGSFAGIVVAFVTGRTILDPLRKVRAALRSVERGNLGVSLPVTDPAELGDLEVGINRMTVGLRERERMRELFGRHVGTAVADRALMGDFGLGGERCEATAMFVDVIASTTLAETRDPEDVVAVLNAFFDAVVRSVTDEGGLVNKFAGDGALAVFGAVDALPDHADRALRATRTLHARLASLTDVEAAIGVSSGAVVAGNVGALDRYEYTVIGDPVNEASRLTEQAKNTRAKVLASSTTIDAATSERLYWFEAGTMTLRGRMEPTVAYAPAPL